MINLFFCLPVLYKICKFIKFEYLFMIKLKTNKQIKKRLSFRIFSVNNRLSK